MSRPIKYRLRIGDEVVGYEKASTYQLCGWLYSKNGSGWSQTPILHDHKDQFTGRLDKNRKEIYERDTLRDDVGDLGIVRFGQLPLDKSGDCVCTYLAFYLECKGQVGRAPTFECTDIGDWMEIVGQESVKP